METPETQKKTNALARQEKNQLECLAMSPKAVKEQVDLIQQVMRDVMQEGEHYGEIPGCKKKSLLQPVEDKLTSLSGCVRNSNW